MHNQSSSVIIHADNWTSLEVTEEHRGSPPVSDFQLAKMITERLCLLYPFERTRAAWACTVDSKGGIFIIRDMTDLSGHGYLEHLSKLDTYDSIMRKAMLIGGEITERTMIREDCEGIQFVLRLDAVKEKEQPENRSIYKPLSTEAWEMITPSIIIAKD